MSGELDRGGWRAYVEPDRTRPFGGVSIWLVRELHIDGATRTEIVTSAEMAMRVLDESERGSYQPAALQIGDDLGRALLDALSAHYGGTSDIRRAREDLLHERTQRDKLQTAVIDLARFAMTPAVVGVRAPNLAQMADEAIKGRTRIDRGGS